VANPLRRFDPSPEPSSHLRSRRPEFAIAVAHEARPSEPVSVRVAPDLVALAAEDADHHLWKNGRLWWIAFTVHRGHLQERIRHSLGTADLVEARRRRDEVLARHADDP
jgi:hypothetical protein